MAGSSSARRRWNARYAAEDPPAAAATFLVERADLLPHTGTALDIAGGAGRNALWLARRGLEVTLVDASDEACRIVSERAQHAGVRMHVERVDLERQPLPVGPWEVVVMHHYLQRRVLADAARRLGAGGILLFCQPTLRNLERHDRPSRRWLLAQGELAGLVAEIAAGERLEIVELEEAWTSEARHEAWVVLRRPPSSPLGRSGGRAVAPAR